MHCADPLFSFHFWNPIYFVGCVLLIAYGAMKKWLTAPEWTTGFALVGIPYFLLGHSNMMLGQGRFTCVVLPMYVVLTRLLGRCSRPVTVLIYVLLGSHLFVWSALFAAWERVF